MNNSIIEIKNVSKTFFLKDNRKYTLKSLVTGLFRQGKTSKFHALKNININIERGEFVGIVGRNGSGKSTLLKIIAGIYNPDKGGKIILRGRLVPFLELGVGFNTELSGRENIYLNGTILGMTKKYIDSKFNEIVEFAELKKFIDTPVKNYSSGMMLRLAFSIAVQSDADIYILDEVLSVGDALFQKKSLKMINDFKAQGKTILYVSHSMGDVEKYCNRAIYLESGEVQLDDEPYKVVEKYNEANNRIIDKEFENKFEKEAKKTKEKYELSSEAIFKKVKFINAAEETPTFNTGDNIEIKLGFKRIEESIKELNINIGIFSIEDNSMVAAFTTSFDGFKIDALSDSVICKILNIPFNSGNYYVSALLYKDNYEASLDALPYALKFKVHNPLEYKAGEKRLGRIVINNEWKQ